MGRAARREQRDDSLGYLVWRLSNLARAHLDARLREIGLTVAQMGTVVALYHHRELSTADLARELHMTPQNLSLIIAKLEEDGYVQRTPHYTHGRIMLLELTALGRREADRAISRALQVDEIVTADLSAKERVTLLALLRSCLTTLAAAPLRNAHAADGCPKKNPRQTSAVKPRRAEGT